MPAPRPVHLPSDLVAAAALAGEAGSRTIAEQIAHWIRVGREAERSPTTDAGAIARVLSGAGSYDTLNDIEQTIVRASWCSRSDGLRQSLNYADLFSRAGQMFSEADADGRVVVHRSRD